MLFAWLSPSTYVSRCSNRLCRHGFSRRASLSYRTYHHSMPDGQHGSSCRMNHSCSSNLLLLRHWMRHLLSWGTTHRCNNTSPSSNRLRLSSVAHLEQGFGRWLMQMPSALTRRIELGKSFYGVSFLYLLSKFPERRRLKHTPAPRWINELRGYQRADF